MEDCKQPIVALGLYFSNVNLQVPDLSPQATFYLGLSAGGDGYCEKSCVLVVNWVRIFVFVFFHMLISYLFLG